MPHAGHVINPALDAILYTPISGDDIPEESLPQHIHPHLTIVINGQQEVIPADIGITSQGPLPLHTHDTVGTIHVESLVTHDFRLQDFFAIWGQSLSSTEVMGQHADADHPLEMTVDGQANNEFGSLILRDGQRIEIRLDTAAGVAALDAVHADVNASHDHSHS